MVIGIDCRLYSTRHTGIGRYLVEMVKNLAELDQKNRYVLYFNEPEFSAFCVPNERWQKKLVNIPHYSIAEQTRFCYFLSREPVDLMHFPHFNAPMLYHKPFVVTIHDLTLHYYPYKSYYPKPTLKKKLAIAGYRMIMGQVVKHAKHVITVSENTKKDLMREYAIQTSKITRIYEGAAFPPPAKEGGQGGGLEGIQKKFGISKPYFCYAGVFRSHKNILNLIRAFSSVIARSEATKQSRPQLVLIGKKDPAYPEILNNGNPNIILTDFVSDEELRSLISGSLAFVFPSLYEGFGLPPLEAQALGVPVISSNSSSLPEVLGDSALYVDPKKPEEIALAMEKILTDSKLRAELIEKGTENGKRFSFRTMAQEILDIYTKIVQ